MKIDRYMQYTNYTCRTKYNMQMHPNIFQMYAMVVSPYYHAPNKNRFPTRHTCNGVTRSERPEVGRCWWVVVVCALSRRMESLYIRTPLYKSWYHGCLSSIPHQQRPGSFISPWKQNKFVPWKKSNQFLYKAKARVKTPCPSKIANPPLFCQAQKLLHGSWKRVSLG